jgi:hypothetical protein
MDLRIHSNDPPNHHICGTTKKRKKMADIPLSGSSSQSCFAFFAGGGDIAAAFLELFVLGPASASSSTSSSASALASPSSLDALVTHREEYNTVEHGLFGAGVDVAWVHNLDIDQDHWTYSM